MTGADAKGTRSDRAVIMARGLGSRMGGPKGLLRFSPSEMTFVRLIADRYLERGIPVDVVVAAQYRGIHSAELPTRADCRVLPAEPGGDTALTLLESWRSCRATGWDVSHFWAHPVDLPLVAAETYGLLEDSSRENPGRIIRPVREGIPGHPVILPYDVLAELEARPRWHRGPLRDFLAMAGNNEWVPPPVEVAVRDQGVDRDFDRPEDLGGAAPPPAKDGFHE